jgi:uncharacterized membrane protein YkvA (DUF1232 family)
MTKLGTAAAKIKRELKVYWMVWKDPRTPWPAKVLLGAAIGYLALPFDLIPDFIPVLGQLDDVVIVPLLFWLALRTVPKAVVADCRRRAAAGGSPHAGAG